MSSRIWKWVYLGLSPYSLVTLADSEQISHYELARLQDQEFLLTKKVIDEKVTNILLTTQKSLAFHIRKKNLKLPEEVSLNPRKIAKGENYKALPYWVSDFPAVLNKKDIWAFRVVVWWGKEISLNLILKGKFKEQCDLPSLPEMDLGIIYSAYADPWQLELEEPYCIKLTKENSEKIVRHYQKADFIKLSMRLDLNEINKLPAQSVIRFDKLMAITNSLA